MQDPFCPEIAETGNTEKLKWIRSDNISQFVKKVVVIGSGFASLSAASFLARNGWDVTVLEKNEDPGGRARQLKEKGFVFDMGPSWYWMPDVFDRYFSCFGKKTEDYYELLRLDPSYRIYWKDSIMDVPAGYESLQKMFENLEPGSAAKLDRFLKEAAYKYRVGMQKLVFKPGQSLKEFLDPGLISGILRLDVFNSIKRHIGKYFKNEKLRQLLEFPVLFLGALPAQTPALYSLMNYADIQLGTWYPKGGMYSIVQGMYHLALELGVKFRFNSNVNQINFTKEKASSVQLDSYELFTADVVVSGADYHFTETRLVPQHLRSYNEAYWNSRIMAPSCLVYYVGTNKKIPGIRHHNLFFDTDFEAHGKEIYTSPQWPTDPLFYVCASSVSDDYVSPEGGENLFFLIPIAAGLTQDDETKREPYFDMMLDRFEQHTGQTIRENIVFKESYSVSNFMEDYNAFKGNAYGLANTLKQTANWKPSLRSKKISNLFYTGQLTVPGPGVPPALISGEVTASQVNKYFGK